MSGPEEVPVRETPEGSENKISTAVEEAVYRAALNAVRSQYGDVPIRVAAERAAQEVVRSVKQDVMAAAVAAVQHVIKDAVGLTVPVEDISLEDEVTQAEAARQLSVSAPTIDRLRKKGRIWSEHRDGRVYVRLSEVKDAIGRHVRPERSVPLP